MHRALSRGEDGVALDLERHEGLWSQSLESWGELGWQGLQTLSLRDREGRPGLPQIRRALLSVGDSGRGTDVPGVAGAARQP